MKILHTISSVNPAGGGPIEGVKQLAFVNQTYGHTIEVASLDPPDAAFLKDFPLPVHPLGPGYLKYHFSRRFVPWLQQHARDYDIVIVNVLWQYQGFGAWRALRRGPTPYVVFTHGMLDPWFKRTYPLKHLKKLLYWPWGEYRVLRDAGAVLFTCEEERVQARLSFGLYRCNEVVVNYGTAGPQNIPNRGLEEFRARFPELRNKRLAIFLGRLHEKKGCDLLIQAFASVLAPNPDWHLLICGPDQGNIQAKLQDIAANLNISNRITWTGMIAGDLKWGALHASEVFVLPSHQENFGIAVAEALACGLPALISDKVNIWQEVQQDGAGIVGTDSLEGTIDVLKTWRDMPPQQQKEMRSKTIHCFNIRFEIHNAAMNLLSVLFKVSHERANHVHD